MTVLVFASSPTAVDHIFHIVLVRLVLGAGKIAGPKTAEQSEENGLKDPGDDRYNPHVTPPDRACQRPVPDSHA